MNLNNFILNIEFRIVYFIGLFSSEDKIELFVCEVWINVELLSI